MTLSLALVGAGRMGRALADAVRDHVPEARIAAAFDPHRPARDSFCQEYGAAPASSLRRLLSSEENAAVLVASPNHLHSEHTAAAAQAGKHVFCEKPMALSLADCDRMTAACKKARVKLMVGQSMRLHPLAQRLLALAADGELGKPVFGLATYFFPGFRPRQSRLWQVERERSGGLFFQMGIHQIDLFQAIFGRARRVQYAGGAYGRQIEDFHDVASILIEFESAATAIISVSAISKLPSTEVRVAFADGHARLDSPWTHLEYGAEPDQLTTVTAEECPGPGPYELEVRSFVRWVLYDEPPVLTAVEGRAAVAVAEAASEAARTGRPALVANG